ncbi:MAG: hypothetical protein R2684_14905 [Pyrinomonadaceae bacterium]
MSSEQISKLTKIFAEAFKQHRPGKKPPTIFVEFYPYVNSNHTIRSRDGIMRVRIAESFKSVDEEILSALAQILVAKLLGKKIPVDAQNMYQEFVSGPKFYELALDIKRRKGSKKLTSPVGRHFDLREVFDELNEIYFSRALEMPILSWSKRKTVRRLGHFDPAHNAIVISKTLDSAEIPAYVLAYVMFHEMLHIVHPAIVKNGRRYSHTPAFRRDESKFMFFEEAEEWIESFASSRSHRSGC